MRTENVSPPSLVQSIAGRADERSCADCHEQAESFWETGHANTLISADNPVSLELLSRINESPALNQSGISLETSEDRVQAVYAEENTERRMDLDWCFGSGQHARTWVGTTPGSWGNTELVEFRWTWYHNLDDFGITPGQEGSSMNTFFGPLGVLFDTPKTEHCFSCHTSYLPMVEGRIDEASIQAGVTCQRCHGPRQAHVDSGGEIRQSFWQTASALDAVNRCGECHRRADERDPEEIRPDNPEIVRFQPVGLVQSPCFKNSERLTCTTCHDPHKPMSAQNSKGIWQCVQCHDPENTEHTLCGLGRRDDCMTCHMPKVRGEAPVYFTDHWIRVREE